VQLVEARDDILWLKVSYDDNKPMSRSLGVKVLPHFQMYRGPSGRVAEFSCSLSKVQKLRDALEEHGTSRCFLGDATPSLVRPLQRFVIAVSSRLTGVVSRAAYGADEPDGGGPAVSVRTRVKHKASSVQQLLNVLAAA